LHQLAVDCPGGLEFLGRAAQVLAGLKELLVKLCYPSCELLVSEFCEDALGEEFVGDEACAFGLGEPVLARICLLSRWFWARAFSSSARSDAPVTRAEATRSLACRPVAWAALSSMPALRSGWS
jgi:hypothetical protein